MARLNIRTPEWIKDGMDRLCEHNGVTLSPVVNELLIWYMRTHWEVTVWRTGYVQGTPNSTQNIEISGKQINEEEMHDMLDQEEMTAKPKRVRVKKIAETVDEDSGSAEDTNSVEDTDSVEDTNSVEAVVKKEVGVENTQKFVSVDEFKDKLKPWQIQVQERMAKGEPYDDLLPNWAFDARGLVPKDLLEDEI